MNQNTQFEKFRKRLVGESICKSLLCAFAVGFAVNFLIAFVTWFTAFNGFWLAVGVGLGVGAALTPLFYFKKFRPTVKQVAARIDALGLEERMLTMTEFEADESYLAMRQREDATAKVLTVVPREMKFAFSKTMIVLLAVAAALGIAMSTVTELSAHGIVRGGSDVIDDIFNPPTYYEVEYDVEEGGLIEGEIAQVVEKGGETSPVLAIADDGYAFAGWSDGWTEPSRYDTNIDESFTVYAVFEPVEDQEQDGEGDGDGEGDNDEQQPGDEDNPSEDDPDDPSDSASGRYDPADQIIDGETYYRDVLEEFFPQALKILEEGGDLPPEMRALIEAYFNSIK